MCVRQPAVAGRFYPAGAGELLETIQRLLDNVDGTETGPTPKALIAPHAGYVFSGPVAASGYRQLQPYRTLYRRVILLGPSHRVAFDGLAASSADSFQTPLGEIPVDVGAVRRLLEEEDVAVIDEAHIQEHSLEVHLPFLQVVIDDFTLVPLAIGRCTRHRMATLLESVWGGPETLIVVSSDLSHYHPDHEARMLDADTSRMIEQLDPQRLTNQRACGCVGIGGLIELARMHGLHIDTVDLRNSGQIVGRPGHVVGYGAYICH